MGIGGGGGPDPRPEIRELTKEVALLRETNEAILKLVQKLLER